MRTACLPVVCIFAAVGLCMSGSLYVPTSLKVSCKSLGNGGGFQNRLRMRENAVDHTTIWLFKGEQLSINFELSGDAIVEVLDVRFSNDGDTDEIGLSIDDKFIGTILTDKIYAWGVLWNEFESSGRVGDGVFLRGGHHSVTVEILDADDYGVEIDYIRLNVQGAVLTKKKDFICIHKPSD